MNSDPVKQVHELVLKNYPFRSNKEKKNFQDDSKIILYSKQNDFKKVRLILALLKNKHADLILKTSAKNYQSKKPEYELSENSIYLKIPSWSKTLGNIDKDLIGICRENIGKYEKIIIDVRENQGGNSTTAHRFASIFFNRKIIFGKIFWKKGSHSKWFKQILVPNKKINIDKKIFILISKKCFSSTELFLAPFKVSKRALLIGERTAGGSANPKTEEIFIKGKKYQVRIPTWRFFLEGESKPLEETAIEPDITYIKRDIVSYACSL